MVGTEPSKFRTAGLRDPHSGSFTDQGLAGILWDKLQIARWQEPIGKTQVTEAVAVATYGVVTRSISSQVRYTVGQDSLEIR